MVRKILNRVKVQNPSELEAVVVSFCDDYIKWGRIEVRWGTRRFNAYENSQYLGNTKAVKVSNKVSNT